METEEQTGVVEETALEDENTPEPENASTDAEENVSEETESEETKGEEDAKPEIKYSEDDLISARDDERKKSQSNKDKELKPLYDELETVRKENAELNNKLDVKANEVLFADETDSHGEERAISAKEARERILKRHQELTGLINKHSFLQLYNDKEGKVSSRYENGLAERERSLKARDYGYKYFPNGDAKTSKVREDYIKELVESDSSSPKELDSLAKVMSMEIQSKSPNKHKPADAKSKTAGSINLEDLDAHELLIMGERRKKK